MHKGNPSGNPEEWELGDFFVVIVVFIIFLKAQNCCTNSTRSHKECAMAPGTVAKSFGLIVQCSIHHTLLSPWCTVCAWAEVVQMCSLAKWAIEDSRRLPQSKSFLHQVQQECWRPRRTSPAPPQRCSSRWGSECPPSMLSLNLHSFLVWNIREFEEGTDGTDACQIQPVFPNYVPPLVLRSHGPWMSINQVGRTKEMSPLKTKASYLTLLIPPGN